MGVSRRVFSVTLVAFLALAASDRQAAAQLSEGWQDLPVDEFLTLATASLKPGAGNPKEIVQAIRKEAARRLLGGDGANAPLTQVRSLYEISWYFLKEDQERALAVIKGRGDEIGGLPFEDFRALYILEERLGRDPQHPRNYPELIVQWLTGRDPSAFSEWQVGWFTRALSMWPGNARCFRVKWTGQVTAPRAGNYRFMVSPHDVNIVERDDFYYRQSMTVYVDGEKVVDVGPEGWEHVGRPVRLEAAAPTALRVEFEYECAEDHTPDIGQVQTDRSPYAVLMWEGPGTPRSVVPPAVLSHDSGKPGLVAEYRMTNRPKDQLTVESLVEPKIDHAWVGGFAFVNKHTELQQPVIDVMWDRAVAPEYLRRCFGELAEGEKRIQHRFLRERRLASYLTPAQRGEFLTLLANRTDTLERMTINEAFGLFNCFRFGAEAEAMELLGRWGQANPDLTPTLAGSQAEFFLRNRQKYRHLTIPMEIYPPYRFALDACLEGEGGECSLSVAYPLAYEHLTTNKIEDWIARLDDRLSNDALAGDKRVNWLIARAMAEEIRNGPATLEIRESPRPLAGVEWLEEAWLVAESDAVRQRVELERLARLTAVGDYDAADAYLAQMSGDTTAYAQQIEQFRERVAARAEKDAQAAQKAYIAELERRREVARGSGDGAAAQRLSELIDGVNVGD